MRSPSLGRAAMVGVVLVAGLTMAGAWQTGSGGSASRDAVGDAVGNPEAAEQAEVVDRHKEALDAFRAAGGQPGQIRPAGSVASTGWAGELPIDPTAPDDWEPAVAADPLAPYGRASASSAGGFQRPCAKVHKTRPNALPADTALGRWLYTAANSSPDVAD